MAKGIEMNGMLRGKRGGVVYSRVNGEQLSRARATQVANPKTTAQMAQRAIFATATHAYSIMKPIVDHSYEGVKYGSKTQQAFMKDALALLRSRAANDDGNFLIPNVVSLAANPYIVSRGTLTSPIHIGYESGEDQVIIKAMNNPTVDGGIVVTAKSFCDALGINKGDQVTFVAIVKDESQPIIGEYAGRDYRRNKFNYARITVKADAADDDIVFSDAEAKWGSAAIVEGFVNNFNASVANANEFSFDYIGDEMLAFGCIRSVKEGDKWLRSTTQLELAEDQLIYNFNDMLPAWTSGGTKLEFESDKYLNNAEQEVVVTTPSLAKVAARVDQSGTITVSLVAALSKGAYAGTPIVDSGDNKHPYTLKANGHVELMDDSVIVDGYITKEFAEKQLGTTIIVDQDWRGKTTTATVEIDVPETGPIRNYCNFVGAQGATKLRFPAVQIARDTDGNCHMIYALDNQIKDADGQPAQFAFANSGGTWTERTWAADYAKVISNYGFTLQDNQSNEFNVSTALWTTSQRDELPEVGQLQYKW